MREIRIDDEVYAYLEKKAITWKDKNPNDTLRRILELNTTSPKGIKIKALRYPRTDLKKLIQNGYLEEGEKVY